MEVEVQPKFSEIEQSVRQQLNNFNEDKQGLKIIVWYMDDDGDRITVACDRDAEEACEFAKSRVAKMKLRVDITMLNFISLRDSLIVNTDEMDDDTLYKIGEDYLLNSNSSLKTQAIGSKYLEEAGKRNNNNLSFEADLMFITHLLLNADSQQEKMDALKKCEEVKARNAGTHTVMSCIIGVLYYFKYVNVENHRKIAYVWFLAAGLHNPSVIRPLIDPVILNKPQTDHERIKKAIGALRQICRDNEEFQIVLKIGLRVVKNMLFFMFAPTVRDRSYYLNFKLEEDKPLGSGQFSDVYKVSIEGQLYAAKKPRTQMILTVEDFLKNDEYVDHLIQFIEEVHCLKNLRAHPNVVNMIAIGFNPFVIILEIANLGSFWDYIYENDSVPYLEILTCLQHISEGLTHLHSRSEVIIHRDVALRNILMHKDPIKGILYKISDLGLATVLLSGEETNLAKGTTAEGGRQQSTKLRYQYTDAGYQPTRWMAPECFTEKKEGGKLQVRYSKKTDVWSFGVALWEMFTVEPPYKYLLQAEDIIDEVKQGKRLSKPDNCPDKLWDIAKCCFKDAEVRPEMTEVNQMLKDLIASLGEEEKKLKILYEEIPYDYRKSGLGGNVKKLGKSGNYDSDTDEPSQELKSFEDL